MLGTSQDTTSLTQLRVAERQALLTTLRTVGPDAPTLCGEWTALDIAAHLVLSERGGGLPMVPVYQLRKVLPAGLVQRGMRRMQAFGNRQVTKTARRPWDWQLRRLAVGPPRAYRLRSVAPIRYIEEWIHHEDVRRANGFGPRPSSPAEDDALWRAGIGLMSLRELLPGRDLVEVVLPNGHSFRIGARSTIRVQGPPGEALLFLAGRTTAAQVDLTGNESDIAELATHLHV